MPKAVVGVGGKAGSGKSTISVALEPLRGRRYPLAAPLKNLVSESLGIPPSYVFEHKESHLSEIAPLCDKDLLRFTNYDSEDLPGRGARRTWVKDTLLSLANSLCAPTEYANQFLIDTVEKFVERWRPKTVREVLQLVGTEIFRQRVAGEYWVESWKQWVASEAGDDDIVVVDDVRYQNERAAVKSMKPSALVLVEKIGDEANSSHLSETSFGHRDEYDIIIRAEAGDVAGLISQATEQITTWLGL
jgi:hypothetical protein